MLAAIRESDNKKVMGPEIEKDLKANYYCDYCKKGVNHNRSKSQVRIGHFKHKPGFSNCPNQTKESLLHYNTKYDIFNYINVNWRESLKVLEIEKWICHNTIRADIFIESKKGNKIAIKVQATILTIDEIENRTSKYKANNIAVLWILPFQKGRFWEYKALHQGYNFNETEWGYGTADKVRLKEMEIWLLYAYNEKLIFWDLDHIDSKAFVIVEFADYINPDQEFRKDGDEHFFAGKPAKTIKSVNRISYDVQFQEFKIESLAKIKVRQKGYYIPNRILFLPR